MEKIHLSNFSGSISRDDALENIYTNKGTLSVVFSYNWNTICGITTKALINHLRLRIAGGTLLFNFLFTPIEVKDKTIVFDASISGTRDYIEGGEEDYEDWGEDEYYDDWYYEGEDWEEDEENS